MDRYLRDVYDLSNDSTACGDATCEWGTTLNDTLARSFDEMLSIINYFDAGFGEAQDEEPYVSSGPTIDNRDGFGVGDLRSKPESTDPPQPGLPAPRPRVTEQMLRRAAEAAPSP